MKWINVLKIISHNYKRDEVATYTLIQLEMGEIRLGDTERVLNEQFFFLHKNSFGEQIAKVIRKCIKNCYKCNFNPTIYSAD